MNILIISRGVPSKQYPQWGNFEKEQALALTKMGHKVMVFCVDRRLANRKWIEYEVIEENDIIFYNLIVPPLFNEQFIITIPILKVFAKFLFKKIVSHGHKIDLIYSHYLSNSILAIDIKKKYNIPLVVIEHWSKLSKVKIPLYLKVMGKMVYKKADQVISVSNSLRNHIFEHFQVDSIVINNMINSEFKCSRRENDRNVFKFVSIGSLIKRKGFDTLIRGLAQFSKENLSIELTIVGDGSELNNLKELARSLGVENLVHFVGKRTTNEIYEIIAKSDAFALTSRSETFGVVYIEAMSYGLPVIGTICGGPEEFITPENGILIYPDDVNSTYLAIKSMVEHINNYDRLKISMECKKRFSSEVISQQLIDCFENVVKKFNHK